MNNRITITHLNRLATMLNRAFKTPEQFTTSAGAINVGHFYIEQQAGRYALVRVMNENGATAELARGSTARETYDVIHAWWRGYEYAVDRSGRFVTMSEAARESSK